MTVLPEIEFTGEDELVVFGGDVREATVKLPQLEAHATSKLVTVEKLVSNKWTEPGPSKERLVSTTHQYIAYVITGKGNSTMVKIMDKEDFGRRTIMKNISGRVVGFMFKCCEEEEDETFALISLDEEGKLHLAVYEIIVTDTQALQNSVICSLALCDNVPSTVTPVLAIQPQDPDTTVLSVAVFTHIYHVKIKEDAPPEIKDFNIEGIDSEIVSMYIAIDEDQTIAVCTKNGTIAFYSPARGELMDLPWRVIEDDDVTVHWMGFPDDASDQSNVWNTVIVASDTSISVFSLQHWKLSYCLNIHYPSNQVARNMRYNLDSRGRFLVLSSHTSSYLYIVELAKTRGSESPDSLKRMFCYPVKHGLFDLSISAVSREENVQGRYEDTSVKDTISIIGISNSAMYKWKALFDTGYKLKCSLPADQPTPLTVPAFSNINIADLPSPRSFATRDITTPPRAATTPPRAITTPPRSITTPPRAVATPPRAVATTPRAVATPPRAVATPPRDLISFPHDVISPPRAVTADLPKLAPKSIAYSDIDLAGDILMPTPLQTPAAQANECTGIRRLSDDQEMLNILCQLFIQGSDTDLAAAFEFHLMEKLSAARSVSDDEFCADFIALYNEERGKRAEVHHTIFNQIAARQLIRAAANSPVVIREICQAYPQLGEDFTCVLMELVKGMLTASNSCTPLKHFTSIREIIKELYRQNTPSTSSAQNLMLRVLEALIKSYFEKEEREEGEEELEVWRQFLADNLLDLTELIKSQSKGNQGFLIQVKDVLEPLKYSSEKFSTLVQGLQDEGMSKLLQIMKKSEDPEIAGVSRYETVVSLLDYLDQEAVSCEEAVQIARRIILTNESSASSEIASAIVNNYYTKGWYAELILLMSREISDIEPVFRTSLKTKILAWFKDHNNPTEYTQLPAAAPLHEGHYRYSSGSSPLYFYLLDVAEEGNLHLINSTLSLLLDDPSNQNTGSLLRSADIGERTVHERRVGELVACYVGYKVWKRGEVVNVYDNDDIRVKLLDYGEVIPTNSACLRPLTVFRSVPAKARCVRVRGISCPEEHSDEVMQYFQHLLKESGNLHVKPEKRETARKVDRAEQDIVVVTLGDGTDLAKDMYRKGYAVATESRQLEEDFSSLHLGPLTRPPSVNMPMITEFLSESEDSTQNLIKLVLLVQEHTKAWANLEPELKDMVLFQVKQVLRIKTEETVKTTGQEILVPATKPAHDVTTTTPEVTMTTRQEPAVVDTALLPNSSRSSPDNTTPSPPDTSPPSSSPPASPPPPPPPPARPQQEQAIFISSDIREKNKVQYVDKSGSASLKKLHRGLSQALNDVERLFKNPIDKSKIDNEIRNCMASRQDGDDDVKQCASVFFDKAFALLHDTMANFYETEMIDRLRRLQDEMLTNQNKLRFNPDQKLENSIRKDVTQMVKAVNEEVQRCLVNRLSAEEALKRLVSSELLPSFQRILQQIYAQFENVLHTELLQYTASIGQGCQTEQEILAHLERVEELVQGCHDDQERAHRNLHYLCSNLETQLTSSVRDLYTRHQVA